jgi:hypothetical protein
VRLLLRLRNARPLARKLWTRQTRGNHEYRVRHAVLFMIVVVANRWDAGARAFASRWPSRDIRVLTCQDLSMAGWRQSLNGDARAAVVEGMPVHQEEITGVLTRLACVVEEELSDIVRWDREYVAAEMSAFLWFWLFSLNCPVLNRPTHAGLCGSYRQEYWISLAAQAGLPVEAVRRRAVLAAPGPDATYPYPATAIAVGECVFGETDPILHGYARKLAELAGLEFLAVRFSGPERTARILSADPFPDLADEGVATAVLERLSCK